MPTDEVMSSIPEFASAAFETFITCLQDSTDDSGKTPLLIDVMSEEGDLSIDWDEEDPKMEFMTLYSEKAVSLFITEMIRRAYEQTDNFSVQTTPTQEEE